MITMCTTCCRLCACLAPRPCQACHTSPCAVGRAGSGLEAPMGQRTMCRDLSLSAADPNASFRNACLHSDVGLNVCLQLLHSGGRGGSVCGCTLGSRLPCGNVRLQPLRLRLQSLRNSPPISVSSGAKVITDFGPATACAGACYVRAPCQMAVNLTTTPQICSFFHHKPEPCTSL